MRKELKTILDKGYELTKRNNEKLYNSEHILLAILLDDCSEKNYLNSLGLFERNVSNILQRIYQKESRMYTYQEVQASEIVKEVISEDDTTKKALLRIVSNPCTAQYAIRCINASLIDQIKNYCNRTVNDNPVSSETNKFDNNAVITLEKKLNYRIVGQEEAAATISKIVKRRSAGISTNNKPIGTLLFVGKTGVGKTEMAKALSQEMFSGNLIRLDMSEYQEKVAITKLIGSAPGYVGYDEGGQLTEAVRKNPHSVVLFDEIEKSHPDIYNVLLQILDEGRLTDNKGNTVDFTNTIIILTSNIGAEYCCDKSQYKEELKKVFKPEFLNRLSDIVVFNSLTRDNLIAIAKKELDALFQSIKRNKNISISIDDVVIPFMIYNSNINFEYGAREIKRIIVTKIEDLISDEIIEGKLHGGTVAKVKIINNQLTIK